VCVCARVAEGAVAHPERLDHRCLEHLASAVHQRLLLSRTRRPATTTSVTSVDRAATPWSPPNHHRPVLAMVPPSKLCQVIEIALRGPGV